MSNTFWINNILFEDYNKILTQKKVQTFDVKEKNKVSRMKNGDKIIYFLGDKDVFIGISEIKNDKYEEINSELISIKIKKGTHLKLSNSVDGNQVGPSLEYCLLYTSPSPRD